MKKLILLFTAAVFTLQIGAAQSVDDILSNYFENMGGKEKLKAMQSRKMDANMSMGGMQFTGTITEKAPNLQRVDVDIQGMKLVQAYDGETAWTINPFATGTEPQKMSGVEAEEFTRQKFEDPFIDYKDKGHSVELEGTEEVEGAECFKIKLTKENGDVEYHFFDAEYYVPIMARTTAKSGPAAGMPSETFFSDYQEVEGLMFPFFIETKVNGQTMQSLTLTSVELDVDLEGDFFSWPGDKDKEDKKKEMSKNAPKGDMKSDGGLKPAKVKKKNN